MKVKRLLTLTFLMFASMLLLVHAVLPHLHHDSVVCFASKIASGCNNSIEVQNEGFNLCCNGAHKATHHHHEQNNLEDCDLKDVVIRQSNSHGSDIIQSVNFLSTVYIIYALNTFYLETSDIEHQFQEKPYLNNYCTLLLDLTFKLRGPPAFSYLG